jgi:hypothetical protein
MGRASFILLATLFFSVVAYAGDRKVYTNEDLEKIRERPILDEESVKKRDAELKAFEEARDKEAQQSKSMEQQERDEKEIRETWGRVKKALSGNK